MSLPTMLLRSSTSCVDGPSSTPIRARSRQVSSDCAAVFSPSIREDRPEHLPCCWLARHDVGSYLFCPV
eukprot:3804430-Rhodomonas_salina.1